MTWFDPSFYNHPQSFDLSHIPLITQSILSQPNQFELQQTNQFSPKTTTQLTQTHTPDQIFI